MSKVRARREYGFVGLGAEDIRVHHGQVFDVDHPLVVARPELFDEVPEPEPAPKRPILSRKPKDADVRP
jgi:hypothetical protein